LLAFYGVKIVKDEETPTTGHTHISRAKCPKASGHSPDFSDIASDVAVGTLQQKYRMMDAWEKRLSISKVRGRKF
jgi:hypothetical protein